MRKVNIEPKRLRTVSKTAENAPWLVLVEGRLGGKPNMEILPPLVVYENGKLSREMIEIYGDYKEGHGDTL
jgi:tRNA1(Val) A37 N6-methylase TrmN6